MPTVKEIISKKGSHVLTIGSKATAFDAALLMNEHKVGALVVVDEGSVSGIFTERDLMQRVVAKQLNPVEVKIDDIKTEEVAYCEPETKVDQARTAMCNKRIRHMPVLNKEHRLLGMISIGDLNAFELTGQETTIHFLQQYLYGESS